MKKSIVLIGGLFAGIIILSGTFIGSRVVTTRYEVKTGLNTELRLVQIADYHSNQSERDNKEIIEQTKEANPDYIILNGDILESEDMSSTLEFVKSLTDISQVIYSRGNHDDQYGTYDEFVKELNKINVITLENEVYQVGDYNIIGFEDLDEAYITKNQNFNDEYCQQLEDELGNLTDVNKYDILIGHRPNYLDCYSRIGFDLVLSGHAHGGQWQMPFSDVGLIAPDDGLFTNNVYGLKQKGETKQIISAGTSNPYRPVIPRLFNPKEIVVIDLVGK